jgi:carboxypeptidase family protein
MVLLCQAPPPASPQMGNIMGTATAVNGDIVAGASVVVEGATPEDRRTAVTDTKGFFEIDGLTPGIPYHVTVRATGFADWSSAAITLNPSQYYIVTDCTLNVAEVKTTVTVGAASSVELATEQLKVEETQRVFGIIPNFYVVYDKNAAPLTAKMKFQLALKTSVDPITFIGVGIIAGIDQATDRPEYVQGAKGFGQRLGASYADGVSDILIGGAILPALLHQDPRYYYQGTGTTKSRALHAIGSAFICKGDNGRWQPNYSTIGGDLAASALEMTYYPDSDRNASEVYESFLIDTAERIAANLAQEFVFRKLTKTKKPK